MKTDSYRLISRVHIPHPALQDLVISIMTVDAALPGGVENTVTPYPPTPYQSIIFYGDDRISMKKEGMNAFEVQPSSVIIGPQYTRVNLMVKKILRAVRVDFLPGGLHRLLGIPMHHLFDEGFDALDVFGNEIRPINDQICCTDDMQKRAAIVEEFLITKAAKRKTLQPLDEALRVLMKSDGSLPIERIASMACLSLRQFQRKCEERLGLSPKTFARIVRFSKAYRIREAQPAITWTAIAHEAGYFDQMHMIRDFKEFAGVTPTILEDDLSHTPFRMQADLLK